MLSSQPAEDHLPEERQRLTHQHLRLLSDPDEIVPPAAPEKCGHAFQSFAIRIAKGGTNRRNRVMAALAAAGIQTWPSSHAVPRLECYASCCNLRTVGHPNACPTEDQSITLPIFPGMTPEGQRQIVKSLKKALAS